MNRLSALELLAAWECGLSQGIMNRALTLLAVSNPRCSRNTLAQLSIGRRDAGLLSLREQLFGSQLSAVTECPSCREQLEFNLRTSDLRNSSDAAVFDSSVSVGEWQLEFRLPTSNDLLEIPEDSDLEEARTQLLERCILSVEENRTARPLGDVPADVIDAVVQRMSEADPFGDLQLALGCPACEHHWQAPFDIARFLWIEINAWAHRILRDVNSLARVYGWTEPDMLALSPLRRQIYLEMISQ